MAKRKSDNEINDLRILNKIMEKSEMTEEDALRLGKQVRKNIAKRFREG